MSGRPAAFLDRDGTIIHDVEFIAHPRDVRLISDAAAAIARLNDAQIPVVVVTNQSGIARGYFGEPDYARVRARVAELLAAQGARIDASYHCPHHPDISGPCECRKPGTLLYRRAAEDLGIDPSRSAYIGDRWRDIAASRELGGRGILVAHQSTPPDERERAERAGALAPSLAAAVDDLLTTYWPR